MKKTMKKYQTGGNKVTPPVTDSTKIKIDKFKLAKKNFKKTPSQETSNQVSNAGTDLIRYNKNKKAPIVIKKHGGSIKKKK